MTPIATITNAALARLRAELADAGTGGKAFRITFEGFG
jgi:hypothetical protein